MTDWYYDADGVQVGPVTVEYLRMLFAEGRLPRETLVWNASLPYWAPASRVPRLLPGSDVPTPLFAVGLVKLVLMTVATLGLYLVFWGYRHWSIIRTRTGQDLWPLVRGIFALFFFHLLVKEVNASAAERHVEGRLPVAALTIVYVIALFMQRLPDPYWLLWFIALIPTAVVQQLANEVNHKAAPLADRNLRLRGWNWLAVIVGLPFFALALYGVFFVPA